MPGECEVAIVRGRWGQSSEKAHSGLQTAGRDAKGSLMKPVLRNPEGVSTQTCVVQPCQSCSSVTVSQTLFGLNEVEGTFYKATQAYAKDPDK